MQKQSEIGEVVGDESPYVSFLTNNLEQNETPENIERFQYPANLTVSRVQVAAGWLSRNRDAVIGPVLPVLRSKFGLTILEAIDAAKLAHALQYHARQA